MIKNSGWRNWNGYIAEISLFENNLLIDLSFTNQIMYFILLHHPSEVTIFSPSSLTSNLILNYSHFELKSIYEWTAIKNHRDFFSKPHSRCIIDNGVNLDKLVRWLRFRLPHWRGNCMFVFSFQAPCVWCWGNRICYRKPWRNRLQSDQHEVRLLSSSLDSARFDS